MRDLFNRIGDRLIAWAVGAHDDFCAAENLLWALRVQGVRVFEGRTFNTDLNAVEFRTVEHLTTDLEWLIVYTFDATGRDLYKVETFPAETCRHRA